MNEVVNQFVLLNGVEEHHSEDLLEKLQKLEEPLMRFALAKTAKPFSLHISSYTAGVEVGQRLKALQGGGSNP